jgi:predicted pyridoxine 5'-phosphate oxidase superfamily flavin-nucleotide-binding protein
MGILTEDMRRVAEAELGFIATVCPDGTPNLSPKGTTAVWDENHRVFADLRSPATVANLRSNPGIEINVVDQLAHTGYRFKGTAAVYTEGEVFDRGVRFYEARGMVKPASASAGS